MTAKPECSCHVCVQFGLTKHPENKPVPKGDNMKTLALVVTLLTLIGCGKPGSNQPLPQVIPSQPTHTVSTLTMFAYREYHGANSPDTRTFSNSAEVTIPQPSDFQVIQNATDFYHVTLNIGSVSCDFIHQSGSSTLSAGAGCSGSSPVLVNSGDIIQLMIGNQILQSTGAQVQISVLN